MDKLIDSLPYILFSSNIVVFVVLAARYSYIGYRSDKYLRENHFKTWKYITSIGNSGPGYYNSLRALKLLFSDDDLGDEIFADLKAKLKNAFLMMVIGFPLYFIITMIIGLKLQHYLKG